MATISSVPPPHVASDKPDEPRTPVPQPAIRRPARRRTRVASVVLLLGLMFCDAIAVNAAFFGVYRQAIPSIRNSGLLLPEQPEAILLYVLIANLVFFGAICAERAVHDAAWLLAGG
ncbi:MAG: hypothetical protein HC893_15295 [Chloroflexaceae bacterium]|nr:hypothetical protein [Chloroflexaceae bacterium]